MPKRKKGAKPPPLGSRIISLITKADQVTTSEMAEILGANYDSVNTEALELRGRGILQKDEHGCWSLVSASSPVLEGLPDRDAIG